MHENEEIDIIVMANKNRYLWQAREKSNIQNSQSHGKLFVGHCNTK